VIRRRSWRPKVLDVLLSVPKYGPVKADKLLPCCRVAPNKTVAGLTERQRTNWSDKPVGAKAASARARNAPS